MELEGLALDAAVARLTDERSTWEPVLDGYIECALWSSYDIDEHDNGVALDEDHGADDIASDSYGQMVEDVRYFIAANRDDFDAYIEQADHGAAGFGHDFWLTRNGHGAGFWDRGLGDLGERLTKAAKVYGSVCLYIGDDGQIHDSSVGLRKDSNDLA
jgi:hypothetical protein